MIEIFYDGSCVFCARLAEKLSGMNSPNIILTNLEDEPYASELYGIKYEDAMREIHGTNGVKTFTSIHLVIEILRILGYKKTAWLLSLPVFCGVSKLLLGVIVKFRKQLGPFV